MIVIILWMKTREFIFQKEMKKTQDPTMQDAQGSAAQSGQKHSSPSQQVLHS